MIEVAIVTGASTLLASLGSAYLTNRNNKQTQRLANEAQNKRASADYLLQKEADGLIELLNTAEHCHTLAQQYASQSAANDEVSDELYSEMNNALSDFESAVRTNKIFLRDDDDEDKLENLLGSIRGAVFSGDLHRSGHHDIARESIDWQDLVEDYDAFIEIIEDSVQSRIMELRES